MSCAVPESVGIELLFMSLRPLAVDRLPPRAASVGEWAAGATCVLSSWLVYLAYGATLGARTGKASPA